ncbi:class I SAM-dependent methyltransferase [Nitratifractor sp.]
MAQKDQEKWDRKYMENPRLREQRPPSRWVENYAKDGEGREALDLACGTGRNAVWLGRHGWKVEAVDLSPVALQLLTEVAEAAGVREQIRTEMIDLDEFRLPVARYDLVVKTNFLDRRLLGQIGDALRPGGLAIVETHMAHPSNEREDANPDFLLRPGELPSLFGKGFEILAYEEYPNEAYEMHRMMKAGIVARKQS